MLIAEFVAVRKDPEIRDGVPVKFGEIVTSLDALANIGPEFTSANKKIRVIEVGGNPWTLHAREK